MSAVGSKRISQFFDSARELRSRVIRDFKIQDAAGSKFSKRRHIAHTQAVVLMASRRVENVSLAILTFCTKREYIPSSA